MDDTADAVETATANPGEHRHITTAVETLLPDGIATLDDQQIVRLVRSASKVTIERHVVGGPR